MKNPNLKKVLCAVITITMLLSFALINSGAKTILRGDVNGDSNVTTVDARLALRGAALLDVLDGEALIAADVDEDGKVQTKDARTILRVAAGLEKFENSEIEIEDATEEPTTEKPTTEEPTTEEPTTEEPTTEEPTTEEPTTEEPTTEEPTTEEPTTEEPTTEEPTTEEPTTEEPTTEEPTTEEPTTEAPAPTVDDKGRTIVTEYPDVINCLFNKKFYLNCVSELNGNSAPMILSMDGKNIEVMTSMDGEKASMMLKQEKNWLGIEKTVIYMKMVYEGNPCYLKLDETTLKLLGMEFDVDSITESFNFGSASDYKHIVCYTEKVGETEYTVYAFVSDTNSELCFCFDESENVKYLILKDSDGGIIEKYNVDTLSATLPADSFSLDGYKELNILEMMGDMK